MKQAIDRSSLFLVLLATSALILALSAAAASAQPLVWDFKYDGPGDFSVSDLGEGLCLAPDGNLLCTGEASVDASGGYGDLVVINLDPNGNEQWSTLYDGGGFDIGYAVTTDAAGNIYVAGEVTGNGDNSDFAVVSFDPSGNFRWVYRYDPTGGLGFANAVAVGPDGNIYACGNAVVDPAHQPDVVVASLTPDGGERWVRHFDGKRHGTDVAWDLAIDRKGNVAVCGLVCQYDSMGDLFVAGLTPNGGLRWAYLYDGTAHGEDVAYEIAVGGDGNYYAAGKASQIGRSRDLIVVSLTPHGQERWTYLYNGTANSHDLANCLTWGTDGNLYVGGKTVETGGDAFTIISLTPSGEARWVYKPTWDGYNGVTSIVTDDAADVYACGWIGTREGHGGRYQTDMGVVSVTPDGTERWVETYSGNNPLDSIAEQIVYDGAQVYAVGSTSDIVWGPEFTVLGFSLSPYSRATGVR
jgi:hypothetical protein